MKQLILIIILIMYSIKSESQSNEKYRFCIELREEVLARDINEFKVLILTLHKYPKQNDSSKFQIPKDEFYNVMSSVPLFSLTISDGLYSIEAQIKAETSYEAILPLNAFQKFKLGATIYGPADFVYKIENVDELHIKKISPNKESKKPELLLNDLKALNGKPPNSFVKKEPQKYCSQLALYKKTDFKLSQIPQIWPDGKTYIFNCLDLKINDSIKEQLLKCNADDFFIYIENESDIVKAGLVKVSDASTIRGLFLTDELERFNTKVIITYGYKNEVWGRIENVMKENLNTNQKVKNTNRSIHSANLSWFRSINKIK